MSLCLSSLIYSIPINERCSYVKTQCEESFINWYSLHFCTCNSNYFLTIPSFIFFLLIFFFLLSDTCNNFLSVGVIKIVDLLKISQNLAGVTLLAFGNGASDVISSLVAACDVKGIEFSIGALLGSGMFVTSFVFGMVVFHGNGVKVNPNMFNRNILLYLLALGMLVSFVYGGYISYKESICFILVYFINIFLAFLQDHHHKKKKIMNSIMQDDIENHNEQKEEKLNVNTTESQINNNNINYNELKSSSEQIVDNENSINRKGKKSNYSNVANAKKVTRAFSNTCGNFVNENIQLFTLKAKQYYYTYKQE